MSDLISPLALEQYLNDKNKLILLHALDGEIWGASIAATELLGYSNEEIRQLYLANIKPKTLRLSDVLKTQKSEDAAVIFERRNGKRFAAAVNTKIIRTTLFRKTVDLVILELEIVNTSSLPVPRSPEFNIQETSDYIQALTDEINTPIQHLSGLLTTLEHTSLSTEQRLLVKNITRFHEDIAFLNSNITDSFKMGVNTLYLERQPFNIVDLLGAYGNNWGRYNDNLSVCIDHAVPELVYGDEKRLTQILGNFTRKSINLLHPDKISLSTSLFDGEEHTDSLNFIITFSGCHSEYHSTEPDAEFSPFREFTDNPASYISKNLIRLMGGAVQLSEVSQDDVKVSFHIALPEVHDLGLKGNRKFLKGHNIVLVDPINSLLCDQLATWGTHVDRFETLIGAVNSVVSEKSDYKQVLIVHLNDNCDFDVDALAKLNSTVNVLLLKPKNRIIDGLHNIMQMPTPYQPALLGNVLSQFFHTQFPFPYSNIHHKRTDNDTTGNGRILVVDDHEDMRSAIKNKLESNSYTVDVAVNGIDGVLACAQHQYDLILMDIHLPYMDGFEAVIHSRKISHLNTETPVILVSGDTSENAKLSMKQIGLDSMLSKPLDMNYLVQVVSEKIDDNSEDSGKRKNNRKNAQKRRADENAKAQHHEAPVDEEVINRLVEDTNRDTCREMVDMFIEESLVSLGELEKCCQSGDWKSVAAHAHDISSSSKTFGCDAVHSLATLLEAESHKSNLSECMRLAAQLPQLLLQSQESLHLYCNQDILQ